MRDKFHLILSYILPKRTKFYAALDWLDSLPYGDMTIDSPNPKYKIVITKTRS